MIFHNGSQCARAYCGRVIATPWRRWFAWYPVSDMSTSYWLCWVEWRITIDEGWRHGRSTAKYYEYRVAGSTRERPLNWP